MLTLGDLERSVMDQLWASDEPLSAYDLKDRLSESAGDGKDLAPTTILTVLSRLEKKNFVVRERESRPHRYVAAASREDHVAELMHQVLGRETDRTAVLARFIGQASPAETAALRELLSPDRTS
ncbi:MAG: BlaI/MecI/CopY family transcriptional regulator [Rhodoglobus sp.]